jgi:hypothetical protein
LDDKARGLSRGDRRFFWWVEEFDGKTGGSVQGGGIWKFIDVMRSISENAIARFVDISEINGIKSL